MALRADDTGCGAQHRGDASPSHILRSHPPAGSLFDVLSRQDDEFCADLRGPGAAAWRAALARRARLGGAASRRRSGGLVCDVRYRYPRNHLLPRALRRRNGRGADPPKRPAVLARRSAAGREVRGGAKRPKRLASLQEEQGAKPDEVKFETGIVTTDNAPRP